MRRTLILITALLTLVGAFQLQAQPQQIVGRDVPAEIESLLNTAISELQTVLPEELARQILTALSQHFLNELGVLYGSDFRDLVDVPFAEYPPSNTARIYSIALSNTLVLLVQHQSTVSLYEVAVSRDRLESAIRYHLQELQISSSFNGMERASQELYGWILQPFVTGLREAGVEKLVFVPSSTLRPLPFSTLFDGRRFIVDDFELALTLAPGFRDPGMANLDSLPVYEDFETDTLAGELAFSKSQRLVDARFPILQLLGNFLPTGSDAHLVSLWPPRAAASAEFMELFSLAMQGGGGYAAALRSAQLQMKASNQFGHPFYWGSYLLVEKAGQDILGH